MDDHARAIATRAALIGLAAAGAWYALVRPIHARAAFEAQTLEAELAAIDAGTGRVNTAGVDPTAAIAALDHHLACYRRRCDASAEAARTLYQRIEAAAALHGLHVARITPGRASARPVRAPLLSPVADPAAGPAATQTPEAVTVHTAPFEIEATGTTSALAAFLDELADGPLLAAVDALRLAASDTPAPPAEPHVRAVIGVRFVSATGFTDPATHPAGPHAGPHARPGATRP